MKPFKFFRGTKSISELYGRPINPNYYGELNVVVSPINRNNMIVEGWNAHRNDLPPGQCPYNIGTREREYWLTGWSARENREPAPVQFNNSIR